jgi:Short C-terminal domain
MGVFGKRSHEEAIYESHYMGFWIKVYPNRVEFRDGLGSKSIPINQIASVQLDRMGFLQITLETIGGRQYTIPTAKKRGVQQAIYDAQASSGAHSSGPVSIADEIVKLYELMKKGIISPAEYDMKKKQLLGW